MDSKKSQRTDSFPDDGAASNSNYMAGTSGDDGDPVAANDAPPAYSDLQATRSQLNPLHCLPNIEFSKYAVPQSTVTDFETITTSLSSYYSNPAALLELVDEQVALAPKPLLRIKGTHRASRANEFNQTVTDFNLTLNLMPLLTGLGHSHQMLPPVLVVENDNLRGIQQIPHFSTRQSLESVAQKFCADGAMCKSFTVTRQIANLDTAYLEGNVRTLAAKLKYTGTLEISFPVANSKIVIRKGIDFTRSLFGTLLPAFVSKGTTSTYDGVKAIWSCAKPLAPTAGGAHTPAPRISEQWWDTWKDAIRNSILSKKTGWVSVEDWMEAAMGLRVQDAARDWGSSGGV